MEISSLRASGIVYEPSAFHPKSQIGMSSDREPEQYQRTWGIIRRGNCQNYPE